MYTVEELEKMLAEARAVEAKKREEEAEKKRAEERERKIEQEKVKKRMYDELNRLYFEQEKVKKEMYDELNRLYENFSHKVNEYNRTYNADFIGEKLTENLNKLKNKTIEDFEKVIWKKI